MPAQDTHPEAARQAGQVALRLGSIELDVPFFQASLSGYSDHAMRQLARTKHYIKSIDPKAFVSITEASEVTGHGFKALPI